MSKPNFNRIKAVLAEKNKTGKELAEELGVAEQTVSTWSTNTKQPSIEKLFAIATILKVEASNLLTKVSDLQKEELQ